MKVVVSQAGYANGYTYHHPPEDVDISDHDDYEVVDDIKCRYGEIGSDTEWFAIDEERLLDEQPRMELCRECDDDVELTRSGGIGEMGEKLLDMDPGDLDKGSADPCGRQTSGRSEVSD